MTISREHTDVPSGFEMTSELRQRVCDEWPGSLVKVKYVLIVPHEHPGCDVEWNLAAGFGSHKGEIYVQFLDISGWRGPELTVEDVVGAQKPENE